VPQQRRIVAGHGVTIVAPPAEDIDDPGMRAVLEGRYVDPAIDPAVQERVIERKLMELRAVDEAKRRYAAEQSNSTDAGERGGWTPIDLTPVLDGQTTPVLPEIGQRHDGQRLLYRGKEHSIASEPECGKTWFAVLQVLDVLKRGGRVVYVDFEDDERTIVGRLRTIGVLRTRLTPEADQFRYARPEAAHQPEWLADLLRFGDTWADLIVYDGMTEGMQLWGLDPLGQLAIAEWRKLLIRPALTVGTATLTTDHVVKNREARGGYAIGAQHKLAGLTGAQFLMERVKPFGRGLKGRSKLLVSKDRNGGLRQHGMPVEGHPGITYIGDLVGDATSGEMESLILWPPRDDDAFDDDEAGEPEVALEDDPKFRKLLDNVEAVLALAKEPLGFNEIKARVKAADSRLREVLAWMEDTDRLVITEGPRRSKLHALSDSVLGEAA
jgi:hypothetical protein